MAITEPAEARIEPRGAPYSRHQLESTEPEMLCHTLKKVDGTAANGLDAKDREIFTEMNNYILDGMPCDRVNEIVENSENKVVWKRRVCVHKDIFDKVGLDVGVFYSLREKWIENFVSEINSNFKYIHNEDDTMEIKRRG